MQIGVENLPVAQLRPFLRLRLLDLDDHVGLREHFRGGLHHFCACGGISAVIRADAKPRAALDNHCVPVRHIFAHRARRQADAVFVVLDFLGAADAHFVLQMKFCCMKSSGIRARMSLQRRYGKRSDIRVSLLPYRLSSKESS